MKLITVFVIAGLMVFALHTVTYSQGEYVSPPQPAVVQGGDVKAQIKTAITHAGFAGSGDSITYVRQHLGHALNCLEGTKGTNFNQSWGHVCQGQGNGILVDLKAATGGAAFMKIGENADALAVAGVKSGDLTEAKMAAKGVAALLGVISDNLK